MIHACTTLTTGMFADYTIRMNFTVVPRTWSALNKHRHDVSISYKVTQPRSQVWTVRCDRSVTACLLSRFTIKRISLLRCSRSCL